MNVCKECGVKCGQKKAYCDSWECAESVGAIVREAQFLQTMEGRLRASYHLRQSNAEWVLMFRAIHTERMRNA